MNRIIIACRTLEQELNAAMAACDCRDPVIWLEAGGHNVPRKRRESVDAALRQCAGYDTVILAMSFCGNSLIGLSSGMHRLVLPRFDDCIPLLLGKAKRKTDAYYLNAGWLSGKDNLLAEYNRSADKYGQAHADRIFSAMLRYYGQIVWLGDDLSPAAPDAVKEFAARFGLSIVTEKSNPLLLDKLLSGNWDADFVIIPPETPISLEMRNGGCNYA